MREEKTEELKKDFKLKRVKKAKVGGLNVYYSVEEEADGVIYVNKNHIECTKDAHKDLLALFGMARSFVATVYGVDVERLEVTAFSMAGKGDNEGCVITAEYTTTAGEKSVLRTPRLKYKQEVIYGFEMELGLLLHNLENEVYEYLFNGKTAELTEFGE